MSSTIMFHGIRSAIIERKEGDENVNWIALHLRDRSGHRQTIDIFSSGDCAHVICEGMQSLIVERDEEKAA